MGAEIFVPISMFAVIFGIVYLYLSTRNKERLALIEKGADATIFMSGKSKNSSGKIIIFKLSRFINGDRLRCLFSIIIRHIHNYG